MKKTDLSTVKDCRMIRSCGDFVVASGKSLWVFRKDGSFVSRSKTIRYSGKLHFLPPDRILIEGGNDDQYHYVDLLTGDDIWTTPLERKSMLSSRRFAASPDGRYLYDMYCHNVRNIWYVQRFSLDDRTACRAEVPDCLRTTTGIYTDEEGILYALQTHHLTDDGKISQNGILRIDWRGEKPVFSWERMWQSEGNARWKCTDGHYILCDNYSVVDMTTMQSFSLLENEPEWKAELGFLDCVYMPERKLLVAYHSMLCDGNVVIDCGSRKRVAQYALPKIGESTGYAGCLIGDEYWFGTEAGIVRKSFPVFEEMPERKSPYWMWAAGMEKLRSKQLNKKNK